MITVTPTAVEQIKNAADQGDMAHLSLRVAAKKNPDGSFEYGIGFDEATDDDMVFKCEDIEVCMAPESSPLLSGATIDFVELEPGEKRFIVLNPNDPDYVPPEEGKHVPPKPE